MKTQSRIQIVPCPRPSLEMEAAEALLMLRYQYKATCKSTSIDTTEDQQNRPPSPSPPPAPQESLLEQLATVAAAVTDNCTPKEQLRTSTPIHFEIKPPLKKRSVPAHILRRSVTPPRLPSPVPTPPIAVEPLKVIEQSNVKVATISGTSNGGVVKGKYKAASARGICNKSLLKSCRNMIREFLDNQEKVET